MFKKVDPKMSFPKMEEEILHFWDEQKIFEKSVKQRDGAKSYSFYDGPPFATGTPHYGHIVASAIKDTVPRYFTMKGFQVERKWGWDCHGLPIENIAEKELGITRKKEIENLGVEKFNETCRSKVLEYVAEWKKVIRRFGRWADMENAYKTMDINYMESVWRVFKELWDRGLIYESYRTMHICPRCETTLSQSEVAEGYKMVKDFSAIAKFELDQAEADDVVIASIEQNGKYLFVRQKEEGQYFFVGGKAEKDETLDGALVRECREEIGADVKVGKKLYQSFRVYHGQMKRLHVFETEIISGEPILQEDEHDELVWREREAVEDFYKDLEMNRMNLVLDGQMPADMERVSLLAWTTTPWTLPGNVALALGKDMEYAMVYSNNFPNELLILAKDRLEAFAHVLGEYSVVFVQKGEQLIGAKYLPLFDYYSKDEKLENRENGWKIYGADFVTTDEGTGVVHIAPAFGEDDMELGKRENLSFIQHVKMDGTMKECR
jgi:isoleucyl-tRNA synthetase